MGRIVFGRIGRDGAVIQRKKSKKRAQDGHGRCRTLFDIFDMLFQMEPERKFGQSVTEKDNRLLDRTPHFCGTEQSRRDAAALSCGSNRRRHPMKTSMKICVSPRYRHLTPFVRSLASPEVFSGHGTTIHDGRNTVKVFDADGSLLAVKRYGHISLLNRLLYGVLRPSKAERAYRHAIRLRALGIDTPEQVAFVEVRRRGLLDGCYFVAVHSGYRSLRPVAELDIQRPEVAAVLDALADFLFRMHNAGVLHKDLNIGNILYRGDRCSGYAFQVIDTNRMRFYRSLSMRRRLDNLRRLSCPAPAYLYILDRYARLANANTDSIQLTGAVMRLFFEMRQRTKRWVKSLWKDGARYVTRRRPLL